MDGTEHEPSDADDREVQLDEPGELEPPIDEKDREIEPPDERSGTSYPDEPAVDRDGEAID